MEMATQKARVLIEALPYIQAFRDAWVVVKFGGSAMEDPATIEGVLQDIVFMECVGMRPIIVHGGGKAISRGMKAHGIEARFIKGLRVTCAKTIEIVEHEPIDILLIDMHMDVLTGIETVQRIRPSIAAAPCILVTADATDELRREADVHAVLSKPVEKQELVTTVSTALHEAYDDPDPFHRWA